MKREARLQAARAWLAGFGGKDVIRSYARWFAVDWLCAIKELRLLVVAVSEARVQQLEAALKNRRRKSRPPIEVVFDPDAATPQDPDDVPF